MIDLNTIMMTLTDRMRRLLRKLFLSAEPRSYQRDLARLGIRFTRSDTGRPLAIVSDAPNDSQAEWITELINADIQEDPVWTNQLVNFIELALKDEEYRWSGTANSIGITITNDSLSLSALYGQFNQPRHIDLDRLLIVLQAWSHFIAEGETGVLD